jgi:hypothetical protein
MIFDDCERTDESWGREIETPYEFYNRSAQPEAQKVRQLLESMLSRYPEGERAELVSRFKSKKTSNFETASFELILHDTLHGLGCELTPHPQLDDSSKHPDFFVTTPCGNSFYLEAVSATAKWDPNAARRAAKKGASDQRNNAIATLVNILKSTSHDNFCIFIRDKGTPSSRPSCGNLLKAILGWLDTLDPDKILEEACGGKCDKLPVYELEDKGWKVHITALPLSPDHRGQGGCLFGGRSLGVARLDTFNPIKRAIARKGKAYGALEHPFLIAANVNSLILDAHAEVDVLFGQEGLVVPASSQPYPESEIGRTSNGVWLEKARVRRKGVSGVWFFANLSIHSIAHARQTIYFNPWATSPLLDFLKQFPHAVVRDDNLCRHDGKRLATILGLPESQPAAKTF